MNKHVSLILVLLLLTSTLTACGSNETKEPSASASEITITDQIGREVTLSQPAEKIVSSYYISTALLIALGCEDNLVGIEKKADTRELYKLAAPQLLDLPAVGSGKGINIEETAALAPDLVVLPAKLKDNVPSFEELKIPVIVVDPETQENFENCVSLLAKATGKTDRGKKLLTYYQDKTEEIQSLTKNLDKPSVYLAAGSEYLSTCTSKMYQHELIALAGGKNVSEELTSGYWQKISPEQLVSWNPEYCFAVSYAEYTLDDIKNDSALKDIDAVKNGNVTSFPSEIEPWDYPTPSSILGIMWLTNRLHPEVYDEKTYLAEAQKFYQTYFEINVTEAQLGL